MFASQRIITRGDIALSQVLVDNDLDWHGRILRSMVRAFDRTVPFATGSVVARVTFLSSVGMYSFCRGNRQLSYDIFAVLHEFTSGRMRLLDMVRCCRDAQVGLNLSKEFCDEVLAYFRENAHVLIRYINTIPGDLELEPDHQQMQG